MMRIKDHLLADPAYCARINESIPDLSREMAILGQVLRQPFKYENFEYASDAFYKIFSLVPLLTFDLYGKEILRGKMHSPNSPLPSQRRDITYNILYKDKIKLGRFNGIKEALFYGALPTEYDISAPIDTCALECCKDIFTNASEIKIQEFVFGAWKVNQPMKIVVLCFDDLFLNYNPILKQKVEEYFSDLHECLKPQAASLIIDFFKNLSKLSRISDKDYSCYKLLVPFFATLRHFYLNEYDESIKGLIYPSAATNAKGLNVVLTPEATKQHLQLDYVFMYRCNLEKGYGHVCSDMVPINHLYKFKITNYTPPS